jgi:hypothetical protein
LDAQEVEKGVVVVVVVVVVVGIQIAHLGRLQIFFAGYCGRPL